MRVPDGEFFLNLAHGQDFSFSRRQQKIIKFHTYINVIRVKNENCEFLRKLCTDFLVPLPVETPWILTLLPQKQRKFTVQKPRNTIQKSGRFKKQAKHFYQQLPQQRHLGSERFFQKQSKAVGLSFLTFQLVLCDNHLPREKLFMHM